jgi:hypothetical protein
MAEQSDIIRNLSDKVDKLLSDQASLTEQAKKLKSELNDITSKEVIRTLPEKIKGAIPAPTSPLTLKASKSVKDLAAALQTSTLPPEHQPSDDPRRHLLG